MRTILLLTSLAASVVFHHAEARPRPKHATVHHATCVWDGCSARNPDPDFNQPYPARLRT